MSNGIFPCPLASGGFISRAISLVDVGNLRHQRIIGVRVGQHGADGEKHYIYQDLSLHEKAYVTNLLRWSKQDSTGLSKCRGRCYRSS